MAAAIDGWRTAAIPTSTSDTSAIRAITDEPIAGVETLDLAQEPHGVRDRHGAESDRSRIAEQHAEHGVGHTDGRDGDSDGTEEHRELPLSGVGTRVSGPRVAQGEVG